MYPLRCPSRSVRRSLLPANGLFQSCHIYFNFVVPTQRFVVCEIVVNVIFPHMFGNQLRGYPGPKCHWSKKKLRIDTGKIDLIYQPSVIVISTAAVTLSRRVSDLGKASPKFDQYTSRVRGELTVTKPRTQLRRWGGEILNNVQRETFVLAWAYAVSVFFNL